MKKVIGVSILLLFFVSFAIPASASSLNTGKTYTVLVGAENINNGVGVMSFFPTTLTIHVGDTVMWKANTHTIHTVTFLANNPMPDFLVPAPSGLASPLMINPLAAFPAPPQGGLYDGSSYANSGILSTDPGNATQFSLTFTRQGSFSYLSLVDGMMMSGAINVVADSVTVKSPAAVSTRANHQVIVALAKGKRFIGAGLSQVPDPVHNPDGTTNYTVLIGFSGGSVDLMHFFPSKLVVHPGDTVHFMLSKTDSAPHTVTFLNGNSDIPLVIVSPNPPHLPFLLINPQLLAPINPGVPLNKTEVFSSRLLLPGNPNSFTLKIGDTLGTYQYQCLVHDTSGMLGELKVVPK